MSLQGSSAFHSSHGASNRARKSNLNYEQRDEIVVQILAKVHDSISADKLSSRDVYIAAYRCTADDLFLRHPEMAVETGTGGNSEIDDSPGHAGPANDHPRSSGKESSREDRRYVTEGWTNSEGDNSDNESSLDGLKMHESGPQTGKDRRGKRAEDPRNARRDKMAAPDLDESIDHVETRTDHPNFESHGHSKDNQQCSGSSERPSRGQALKREILETSQSIFRAFLPSQGSSSHPDYYHPVCERFWGSLDDIFRVSSTCHQELAIQSSTSTSSKQITWSMGFHRDDLSCVTRDFDKTLAVTVTLPEDPASKKKRSFGNCEPCNKGQTYKSPKKAAEHLHDVHFHGAAAKHSDRLHDDPCMVWIKEATDEPDRDAAVLREAQVFVEHLSSVSGMISEIQWLVATSVRGVRSQTTRPRLPSSLVHAFETLLSYYVCTAKQLSLVNRSRNSKLAIRLPATRRSLRKVRSEVMDLLDKAKKDVLLAGTTDLFENTLGLQAVP